MKRPLTDFPIKILKMFKGVRLSAVVIALLILIYFLGLVLPQKWMFLSAEHYMQWKDKNILNTLMDAIGFTDIYLSPVTITLLALFFINLLVVIIYRVPVIMKRAYLTKERPSFTVNDLKKGRALPLPADSESGDVLERASEFFKKKKWHSIQGDKADTFLAIRNRLSPIGFLFFHFSFLLCLAGGLLITYTRFSGEVVLTEGQEFNNDIKQFKRIIKDPKIFKELPPLALLIDKVEPRYQNDIPTELQVYLKISYKDDPRNEVIKVNQPVHRGPVSIIAQSVGVSPLFIVKGPDGRELDASYVSLNVLRGAEDAFRFDTDPTVKFNVKFYPDYIVEDGVEKTRSIELKNPAMHLSVEREGEIINEGTIKQGEYIKLGVYTKIGFQDIRYWVDFMIVREYGKIPLMTGFLLAAVGLIMRLVFYQRRIRIAFDYSGNKPILYMDGKSEYFHHSYKDEMDRFMKEMESFLNSKR